MTELWGGRFEGSMSGFMRAFSSSLPVDRRLARYDIAGSRAHAHALRDAGVLDQTELELLLSGLDQVEREMSDPGYWLNRSDDLPEDIHSAVEQRLVELVGDTGRKLHAGRSRNDQVVTDVLLWLRDTSLELEAAVTGLQQALIDQAEANAELIISGYTHCQRSQPVLLAHHLMGHFAALQRDVERLRDARRRADRCPLGAGAGAGSTLPLDRQVTAARLGFAGVAENSLDAVTDRDWALEFAATCAIIMSHVARLAEELVLWSTEEFGVARLGDSWSTGSSMMPQKRNPDAAELVRAKSARVQGALVTLLTLVKGLPFGYNRDLQEDKPPLFDSADTTIEAVRVMAAVMASTSFRPGRETGPQYLTATDLAEEMVRRGVPFRTAHARVGALVLACEASGRGLDELTVEELRDAGLEGMNAERFSSAASVAAKQTLGSTSPRLVHQAMREARALVGGVPAAAG